MPAQLFLIRHGQTDGNLYKRYCGCIDIGLNDQGRRQAQALAGRLKDEAIDAVYSSDRKRAVETAGIVFGGRPVGINSDLREIHFGFAEGLSHEEVLKYYREPYTQWLQDPFNARIPGGESVPDFTRRVTRALDGIAADNPGKKVAVVSHGGVLSIFLNGLCGTRDFWGKIPGSTGLTIVEYDRGEARVLLLNDTAHLVDL